MILALYAFPYHDGWLLYDERLRHDRFLDEQFLSFRHELTLSLAIVQSLLLHLASRSFWSASFACFHSLLMVLFLRRLVFSLQLSFSLIYTQSFLVFLASVFMIYGECGLRMECSACEWLFSFFFACRQIYTYMRDFLFHSIWLARGVGNRKYTRGLTLDFFCAYFLSSYTFASLISICLSRCDFFVAM